MLANGNGVQGSYSDDDAGKFLQMVIAPNENESRNRGQNENSMVFIWRQCMPSSIIRLMKGRGILPSVRELEISHCT